MLRDKLQLPIPFEEILQRHEREIMRYLLRLSGDLWTFSPDRLARPYPEYDHDELSERFEPILSDIQMLLSFDHSHATRLDLIMRSQSAYVAAVTDRSLFRNATFVLEVSAALPLTQIQQQFPQYCKVGPDTRMNDIVRTNLRGIDLVHMPTPPRQIRAISDHLYFFLDRTSALWPEFSTASSLGLHISGDWPELEMELWAILEERR